MITPTSLRLARSGDVGRPERSATGFDDVLRALRPMADRGEPAQRSIREESGQRAQGPHVTPESRAAVQEDVPPTDRGRGKDDVDAANPHHRGTDDAVRPDDASPSAAGVCGMALLSVAAEPVRSGGTIGPAGAAADHEAHPAVPIESAGSPRATASVDSDGSEAGIGMVAGDVGAPQATLDGAGTAEDPVSLTTPVDPVDGSGELTSQSSSDALIDSTAPNDTTGQVTNATVTASTSSGEGPPPEPAATVTEAAQAPDSEQVTDAPDVGRVDAPTRPPVEPAAPETSGGELTPPQGVTAADNPSGTATAVRTGPSSTGAVTVERVVALIEQLRAAPPPRTVTVDLEALGGMRIVVSLRGDAVTIAPVGGQGLDPGLGADLSRSLAERGLQFAGDGSTESEARRQSDQESPDQHPRPQDQPDRRGRGLRLGRPNRRSAGVDL